MAKIRVEIHTHTNASYCGTTSVEKLIERCQQNKIDVIAITDHNYISAALALQQNAPAKLRVVIGEEITSTDGEIVGLFLKEVIPGRKFSAEEVLAKIREQGGLSMIPHPFDHLRGEAVVKTRLDEIAKQADLFEVFNARCVLKKFNNQAMAYATEHNLTKVIGSDAHLPQEFGNCVMVMDDFNSPSEFLQSLKNAEFETKYASPLVHLVSKANKIKHKLWN